MFSVSAVVKSTVTLYFCKDYLLLNELENVEQNDGSPCRWPFLAVWFVMISSRRKGLVQNGRRFLLFVPPCKESGSFLGKTEKKSVLESLFLLRPWWLRLRDSVVRLVDLWSFSLCVALRPDV